MKLAAISGFSLGDVTIEDGGTSWERQLEAAGYIVGSPLVPKLHSSKPGQHMKLYPIQPGQIVPRHLRSRRPRYRDDHANPRTTPHLRHLGGVPADQGPRVSRVRLPARLGAQNPSLATRRVPSHRGLRRTSRAGNPHASHPRRPPPCPARRCRRAIPVI